MKKKSFFFVEAIVEVRARFIILILMQMSSSFEIRAMKESKKRSQAVEHEISLSQDKQVFVRFIILICRHSK